MATMTMISDTEQNTAFVLLLVFLAGAVLLLLRRGVYLICAAALAVLVLLMDWFHERGSRTKEFAVNESTLTMFQCPRRAESYLGQSAAFASDNDYDPSDDTCRYCGSLNPTTFMARVEAGDVLLGSTDKNYKVYVRNSGGAAFKQTYRDCYNAPDRATNPCEGGPDKCTHWVTKETDETKFYFQHLDEAQKRRFIELLNEKRIKFEGGYGFYVLPFFCQRAVPA